GARPVLHPVRRVPRAVGGEAVVLLELHDGTGGCGVGLGAAGLGPLLERGERLGVVGGADDGGDLPRAQPSGDHQAGVAGGLGDGGGGLLHDGECPGQPSAGLVDQAPGGLEVEGDGEVGLVRSGGRAGRGDQFGVDLSGDGGLGLPVLGPVAGERVTAVGHGALQHLHGGEVPGAGDTCQRAPPAAHVVVLGGWVEEGEGTAGDAGVGGQGQVVRVVDGSGPVGVIAAAEEGGGGAGAG